jgi:hypothetical protein
LPTTAKLLQLEKVEKQTVNTNHMKTKYTILGAALALTLLASTAPQGLAKTDPARTKAENRMEQKSSGGNVKPEDTKPNTADDKLRNRIRDEAMKKKTDAMTDKKDAMKGKDDAMPEKKDAMEAKDDAMEKRKAMMEKERMERKEQLETRAMEAKEKAEMRRKEFETKTAAIRDERKQKAAVQLADHFNKLNQSRVKHFEDVLEKLEEKVLERISDRTDRFEKRGTNVTNVRTAIKKTKEAIAAAKKKVEEQAKTIYEVKFISEAKLKEAFIEVREKFKKDIEETQEKVKEAREAVHDAAVAYAKAHGEDAKKPEPTPALAPTPTTTPAL